MGTLTVIRNGLFVRISANSCRLNGEFMRIGAELIRISGSYGCPKGSHEIPGVCPRDPKVGSHGIPGWAVWRLGDPAEASRLSHDFSR